MTRRATSIQHFRPRGHDVICIQMLDADKQVLAEAVLTPAETQALSKSLALECAAGVLG